ncbi:MAG: DUF211 domain-containing protein [Candidatus Nezhaarchaeota archaeon]|nr:DUF211 domain-containing protein [Candidatus Nezhaarchaeota archaeon]MCX8142484.1 DUF211 domain-containing protein [Candidatus Nezhaarchaeota archaeon]MDW8050543.1 DUF211 domain-containing protein [Nitrososphaerota archaeon]
MIVSIRRLLIDALKPREVPITELSKAICSAKGVDEVDVMVTEVDAKTETVKITIIGSNIDYDEIVKIIAENGAAIRSIDQVIVSKSRK